MNLVVTFGDVKNITIRKKQRFAKPWKDSQVLFFKSSETFAA